MCIRDSPSPRPARRPRRHREPHPRGRRAWRRPRGRKWRDETRRAAKAPGRGQQRRRLVGRGER
eukprot:491505-Alexandrium_andersonii.AAC.1